MTMLTKILCSNDFLLDNGLKFIYDFNIICNIVALFETHVKRTFQSNRFHINIDKEG